MARKKRPLDVRKILAVEIFLGLGDDEFDVGHRPDDRADVDRKTGSGLEAPVAVRDLIAVRHRWMRTGENRDLLAALGDACNEGVEFGILFDRDAVADEGRIKQRRVERNDLIARGNL